MWLVRNFDGLHQFDWSRQTISTRSAHTEACQTTGYRLRPSLRLNTPSREDHWFNASGSIFMLLMPDWNIAHDIQFASETCVDINNAVWGCAWNDLAIKKVIYSRIKHSIREEMNSKELPLCLYVYSRSKSKCRRDYTDKLLAWPDLQQSGGWIVRCSATFAHSFKIFEFMVEYTRFSGALDRRAVHLSKWQHDRRIYPLNL